MNINVLMTINADGHLIRRNMFALPTKVFECEGLHKVFDHRLVMIPQTILPKMYGGMPPMQFDKEKPHDPPRDHGNLNIIMFCGEAETSPHFQLRKKLEFIKPKRR